MTNTTTLSRRELLIRGCIGAGAFSAASVFGIDGGVVFAADSQASLEDHERLLRGALNQAEALGCDYAGIRREYRREVVVSCSPAASRLRRFTRRTEAITARLLVYVWVDGAAGSAEAPGANEGAISQAVETAVANGRGAGGDSDGATAFTLPPGSITRDSAPADVARHYQSMFDTAVTAAVARCQGGLSGMTTTVCGELSQFVSSRGECACTARVWMV